jgi:hypothetical protein
VEDIMALNANDSVGELYDYLMDGNGICIPEHADFGKVVAETLLNGGEVEYDEDIILKDSSFVNNQKASCIYNKLSQSPKFKTLFVDTFGENDNLNITFKIVNDIPGANGNTGLFPGTENNYNTTTGEVNLNLLIKLDAGYINSSSAIAVAKTILHESIHAYLILKHVKCNIGTPFDDIIDEIEDKNLEELLNYYYDTACSGEEQHEFMFEHMIPTMSDILAEIRDELIPENHQQSAEEAMFINENNPIIDSSGEYVNDSPWNWVDFYKYLSMVGLHQTNTFINNIQNSPSKYYNYNKYGIEYGTNLFKKDCVD